jgi:hypothetical protein
MQHEKIGKRMTTTFNATWENWKKNDHHFWCNMRKLKKIMTTTFVQHKKKLKKEWSPLLVQHEKIEKEIGTVIVFP